VQTRAQKTFLIDQILRSLYKQEQLEQDLISDSICSYQGVRNGKIQ